MPIVPFRAVAQGPRSPLPGRDPPDEPWALMAAAQMHAEGRLIDKQMSGEESIVRSQGSARFDPDNASDEGKELLKHLPDDIERIDRGNTIELRLKAPAVTS